MLLVFGAANLRLAQTLEEGIRAEPDLVATRRNFPAAGIVKLTERRLTPGAGSAELDWAWHFQRMAIYGTMRFDNA